MKRRKFDLLKDLMDVAYSGLGAIIMVAVMSFMALSAGFIWGKNSPAWAYVVIVWVTYLAIGDPLVRLLFQALAMKDLRKRLESKTVGYVIFEELISSFLLKEKVRGLFPRLASLFPGILPGEITERIGFTRPLKKSAMDDIGTQTFRGMEVVEENRAGSERKFRSEAAESLYGSILEAVAAVVYEEKKVLEGAECLASAFYCVLGECVIETGVIRIRSRSDFVAEEAFLATLAHEATHTLQVRTRVFPVDRMDHDQWSRAMAGEEIPASERLVAKAEIEAVAVLSSIFCLHTRGLLASTPSLSSELRLLERHLRDIVTLRRGDIGDSLYALEKAYRDIYQRIQMQAEEYASVLCGASPPPMVAHSPETASPKSP